MKRKKHWILLNTINLLTYICFQHKEKWQVICKVIKSWKRQIKEILLFKSYVYIYLIMFSIRHYMFIYLWFELSMIKLKLCQYLYQSYVFLSEKLILILFLFILFLFFYLLYRYSQLRIESTQPILSSAFRANIPFTKSQTGYIMGVSGNWKHWGVSNTIRCSTPIVYI